MSFLLIITQYIGISEEPLSYLGSTVLPPTSTYQGNILDENV